MSGGVKGVLAQEVKYPTDFRTAYIAASYVKYLESGGARVVPVMINRTVKEYTKLFNSINGYIYVHYQQNHITFHYLTFSLIFIDNGSSYLFRVGRILFPGGITSITSSGYQRAAQIFYDLAIEANKSGDYFPVWGTCLGFQQLMHLTSKNSVRTQTDTHGIGLPLNFTNEAKDSRMFKDFPPELMEDLSTQPLTENSHKWSVTVETLNTNEDLKNFYKVLSTNTDGNVEFVSTVEAYDYPIYGTQWHPEKNAFEWLKSYYSHSRSAVKTTFYMAEFFVNEARKSFHRFETEDAERKALIYNYRPVFTGVKSCFLQKYFF
uniref:folate gamma-glutamyl hydrolase n=1 Tax=Sphaeramia orbicularis TaxID=375764 RepID=A0A673CV96_9TELE